MYYLKQFPFCGLSMPREYCGDRADARYAAAQLLKRRRRQGFPVIILARGARWEILEPADAVMVPDQCGTVAIQRETFECRECGFDHDDRDSAAECCADMEE